MTKCVNLQVTSTVSYMAKQQLQHPSWKYSKPFSDLNDLELELNLNDKISLLLVSAVPTKRQIMWYYDRMNVQNKMCTLLLHRDPLRVLVFVPKELLITLANWAVNWTVVLIKYLPMLSCSQCLEKSGHDVSKHATQIKKTPLIWFNYSPVMPLEALIKGKFINSIRNIITITFQQV